MKQRHFFILTVSILICSIVNAQALKPYTWDSYKMKFKIVDNMRIVESSGTKFEATNSSITMDIYPRTGENLSYTGMKAAIVNWATQTGLRYNVNNSSGNAQPIYLKDLNGYWGCAIDGIKNSSSATMLLLVDPDYPDISFYIWIAYNEGYYQDASQILKSFKPL